MRRIDHVVVAVRDLDAAADFYQRLGFQIGARNRHPWGTENRLIQFGSSFIELITIGPNADVIPPHEPRHFSFGAFVRDYLGRREGLAMLVLNSADAKADAVRFAARGIGAFEPFYFERQGRRPDGSLTQVAFTLAFAVDTAAPDAGFFVCQQHFPENFWNPAFQRHPNGATDIAAIGITAACPHTHENFLAAFSGVAAQRSADGALSFGLANGRLELLPHLPRPGTRPLQLSVLTVRLQNLDAQIERLREGGIGFLRAERSIRIPADGAFSVEILFQHSGAG